MRFKSKAALLIGLAVAWPVAAEEQALDLPGDFVSMVEVRGDQTRLAAFTADKARPRRQRSLNWVVKKGTYSLAGGEPVPADAAAFDVCALDPARPQQQSLLYIEADGIAALGQAAPLVRATTVLAHVRDDALPRVRVCFDLFPGEAPALVVPRLDTVEIWRAKTPLRYERHASLPIDAGLRFFGQPLRTTEGVPNTQRLSVRLELPDITATDYDGDGTVDLCLCREDRLACHTQKPGVGFSATPAVSQYFGLLSDDEEKDTTQRVECRLVELTGDKRVDLVLLQSTFNLSEMGASLHIFPQAATGGFSSKPAQVIERKGYFAYQEYFDLDGDGRTDIVAPTASLSWSEIVGIYLSRRVDVEFVVYKNEGNGKFAKDAKKLHEVRFPIELKNFASLLGVIPVWNARFKNLPRERGRQMLFFPERKAVELYLLEPGGGVGRAPLWRTEAELGSEVARLDLDGDGYDELAFAYPRDPKRSRRLLFIAPRDR